MEKKFESKLRKYFLKLRRESLRALENATKALTPEERQKLIELLMGLFDDGEMKREVGPIYTEASQNAGEMALDNIGVTRPFIINDAILQSRMRYITEVNQTMFEEIRKIVDQSIVDGDTIPNLERTLKSKFNTWTNKKAKLVARTETASIMSAQTQFAYEQEGVKQKRWIATPDEKTRPSHKACERQGAIGINEKFSNGLLFPGDSANDATGGGEVISCRCSLAPEVV
jgi:SPP1 gp7 family putative phage head morphogenesis protein